MRIVRRQSLTILSILAGYLGLTVALALPLLGHHRPSEALRLESVDRRQGSVGRPLSVRLKGAGFDTDTRFTLVHDSGNQQAIERRIATFFLGSHHVAGGSAPLSGDRRPSGLEYRPKSAGESTRGESLEHERPADLPAQKG